MAQSRRDFLKSTAVAGAGTLSGSVGFPMVSRAQVKTVVVEQNRGYYKEEDEAMIKIAEDFEERRVKVDISFTIQEDLLKKLIAAIQARRVPDVAFCFYNDWEIIPNNAWNDKLTETTDLIQELKPLQREVPPGRVLLEQRGQEASVLRGADRGADHAHPLLAGPPQEAGMPDAPRQDPAQVGGVLGLLEEGAGHPPEEGPASTASSSASA